MADARHIRLRITLLLVAIFAHSSLALAEPNWPRFRGPDGTGHTQQTGFPVTWSQDQVVWRTELEGAGHSSPVLWGDRLFVTTSTQGEGANVVRKVICLDRNSGKMLWSQTAATGPGASVHKMNSYATATCATDGRYVAAFFGNAGLHCFDVDGNKRWQKDLGSFGGPWGTAGSPIIVDGAVIQNCDRPENAALIAFELETGDERWRADRGKFPRGGWSTPIVIDTGTRRELVLNGEFGVKAYDPADGKELWFCKGFNGRGTPAPAWGAGLVYVVCGKPGDCYAVRPGGSGNVTETHMVWHATRRGGRDLPSPIFIDGYVLVASMKGVGTCYEASSGQQLWTERLGGNYSASPIAAGGLVYFQSESGEVIVIKPGKKLEIVARNKLAGVDGEIFRGSPAPSNGRIFLRSHQAVYCIGPAAAQ